MKNILKVFFLATILAFFSGCGESPKPTSDKSATVLAKLKQNNLQEVDYSYVVSKLGNFTRAGAKAVVLDARPAKVYHMGHVPSAILLPDTQYAEYKNVIKDVSKDTEIITYCGGYECGKSVKLALMLKKDGFTNVKVYQAGFPDWKSKNFYEISDVLAVSEYKKDAALFIMLDL